MENRGRAPIPGSDLRRTHTHSRTSECRSLQWVLGISATLLVAEVIGGVLGHSVALLADAGHLLTDVAAISLALFAFRMARRAGSAAHTFGYARVEILAALANGLALLGIAGYVAFEASRRLAEGPEVNGPLVLGVAVAGLIGNLVGARILHGHAGHNLNVRGVFLHLVGDSLASAAVVVSALIVTLTGWNVADPIAALVISALILVAGARLVMETLKVLMEVAPAHVDLTALRDAVLTVPGVESVHDLHVWTLTSGCVAMSVHVRRRPDAEHGRLLTTLRERLKADFSVDHLTVQVEDEDLPDEETHMQDDPRCLA